jgi:dynamin 1-like protein
VYNGLNTGTETLITALTTRLEASILASVPKIQSFLVKSVTELEKELKTFGELPLDRSARMHTVLSLIEAFERSFRNLMDGGKGGGDRVRNVLEKALPNSVFSLPLGQTFNLRAVNDTIDFADGLQPYLIAPELSMRRLICDGVDLIRMPAGKVADLVHAVLADGVEMCLAEVGRTHPELNRYAMLKATIGRTALASLEKYREETRVVLTTLVDMETSYFTTSFFRDAQAQATGRALAAKHFGIGAQRLTDDEASPMRQTDGEYPPEIEAQLQRVSSTVTAYLAGVCDSLVTNIPKAVIHKQVGPAKATLLLPLYQKVGGISDEQLQQLLGDDPGTAARRANVSGRLDHLRKAQAEMAADEF